MSSRHWDVSEASTPCIFIEKHSVTTEYTIQTMQRLRHISKITARVIKDKT